MWGATQNIRVANEILRSWSMYNYKPTLESQEEILDPRLWGNSLIRRENKPLLDNKLLSSGIEKILDIYDIRKKKFMTFTEVKHKFRISFDMLFYLGIVAAIPNVWKLIIHTVEGDDPIDINVPISEYASKPNISTFLYWEHIDKKFLYKDTLRILWQRDLGCAIEENEWLQLFPNYRKMITPTKLQYFQY